MAIGDIVQGFRSMKESLNNKSSVRISSYILNPPATREELSRVEEEFSLTPAMRDFYNHINGMHIVWRYVENNEVYGYINFLPVQETFRSWRNIVYFNDADPRKLLYPIDILPGNSYAALYLDNSSNPKVHYHINGKVLSLGIDFEEYLNLLLKSRGFCYWHLAITLPEYENPTDSMLLEVRKFQEIMPLLFSDFDPLNFRKF